jgi:hypothetical protein
VSSKKSTGNVTIPNVETAALAAKAKNKLLEIYRMNPEEADLRKWEVEVCWQYLDKNGSEITTIAVTPKDLLSNPRAAANPAIGLWLQSLRPAGRIAELGSFGRR